jgi:hypothetical protein
MFGFYKEVEPNLKYYLHVAIGCDKKCQNYTYL